MEPAAPPFAVAVLTFWDPWEAPHGGTLRTRALCEAFVRQGAQVWCVFPRSPTSCDGEVDGVVRVPVDQQTVGHRRWPGWLQRLKRLLLPIPTALGARSEQLRRTLADLPSIDLLVVSHLSAIQYHEVVPHARLWLDQSDLWSDFAALEAARRGGIARWTASLQQRALVRSEDRAVRRADVVSAAGWSDQQRLAARTGAQTWWLPTPVRVPDHPTPRGPSHPPVAGFLANFAYHPNRDALELLVSTWLHALRSRGWRVLIAGLGSEAMALPPGVDALGPLADVGTFYDAIDATVAPVRLGGGMKVKVIESLLYERPVIGTAFAVDGFPEEVRAAVAVVDPDHPDIPTMPELHRDWRPLGADVRHRFSIDGFTTTVQAALASAGLGAGSVEP